MDGQEVSSEINFTPHIQRVIFVNVYSSQFGDGFDELFGQLPYVTAAAGEEQGRHRDDEIPSRVIQANECTPPSALANRHASAMSKIPACSQFTQIPSMRLPTPNGP